jgi:hypothetical protein
MAHWEEQEEHRGSNRLVLSFEGSDDGCVPSRRMVLGCYRSGEESVDDGLEIDERAKHAALQASLGEFCGEALDRIEPGGPGRCAMENEARLPSEPGPNLRMLMAAVIVEDHADDLASGNFRLNGVEEADELLVPLLLHASADDLAFEHVEGGKDPSAPRMLLRAVRAEYNQRNSHSYAHPVGSHDGEPMGIPIRTLPSDFTL